MPDANELRRRRHEHAKRFPCPRCTAARGEPCWKLIPWDRVWDPTTDGVRATRYESSASDFIGGLHKERWRLYEERSAVERLGEVVERGP